MKYEVEPTKNGFIVRDCYNPGEWEEGDGGHTDTYVYSTIKEVLQHLLADIEPGSRHDEKRTYIVEAPGDKHDDFTEQHSKVIWGLE